MTSTIEKLTSGHAVAAGVGWNLLGRGAPILVALAMTPVLIGQLGLDRWGLFTLGLALTGMASIFDLGIGAALTRALAERIGQGREAEAPQLIVAAATIVVAVSLPTAVALWFAVPLLVDGVLPISPALRDEALVGLRLLALAVPAIVASSTLWGVMAAYQSLRTGNLVSIPLVAFSYIGPALVLLVWHSIIPVMLALALTRWATAVSFGVLVLRLVPGLRRWPGLQAREFFPLLRTGSWSTVGTVVASLMVFGDRFVVGAMGSLAAVSYYATPLDLVLRFSILPVAVSTSLVPALATTLGPAPEQASALMLRSAALLYAVAVPTATVLVAFAPELLAIWLGADFAAMAADVLRLLAVGMAISCMTTIPSSLLGAAGRFDLGAKLLLLQAVVTIPASVLLIQHFGPEGAAAAYVLRQAANFVAQTTAAARLYPGIFHFMPRLFALVSSVSAALLLSMELSDMPARAVAAVIMLALLLPGVAVLLGREDWASLRLDLGRRMIGLRPNWAGSAE